MGGKGTDRGWKGFFRARAFSRERFLLCVLWKLRFDFWSIDDGKEGKRQKKLQLQDGK
jgi:hypothetical protein